MNSELATISQRPLEDVCDFIRGVSFDGGEAFLSAKPFARPILRAGNIQENLQLDSDLIWVPQNRIANNQYLRDGDIVICMSSGSSTVVGKTCRLTADWDGSVGAFCGIVRPKQSEDSLYLFQWFRSPMFTAWRDAQARGANIQNLRFSELANIKVPWPSEKKRQKIACDINQQIQSVADARIAIQRQILEVNSLGQTIIFESLKTGRNKTTLFEKCAKEITEGIGTDWHKFPILGATRGGLAPAKEPPGKKPERYKPVRPGTVFYNPMRIMIGSIAYMEVDDKPGITSPDYVALTGIQGMLDSRWFYYWLRSPLGQSFIQSRARGAVRERMLFSRLAEGEIELPEFLAQEKASQALAHVKPMRSAIEKQIQELELLPQKLMAQAFEN